MPTTEASISPLPLPRPSPSPTLTEPPNVKHDRLMHNSGIPAGCDAAHGCTYPGAIAAIPAGPASSHATVLGPHSFRVTWVNMDLDGWMAGPNGFQTGPVESFWVSVFKNYSTQWALLRQFPRDVTSATITDAPAGRTQIRRRRGFLRIKTRSSTVTVRYAYARAFGRTLDSSGSAPVAVSLMG